MLVTKINTHIQDALARFLQQYKNIPTNFTLTPISSGTPLEVSRLTGFMASVVDQIQLLENAGYDLDQARQFYNGTSFPAIGAQLDGIGEIVGISRNGLSDTEYLIFILGTIAENFSNTTLEAVLNITILLFQVQTAMLFEFFPAAVAFELPDTSPLQSYLYSVVSNIIQSSLGAGIGLLFLALYPTDGDGAFQCNDAGGVPVGGGFGDATQAGGGGFAGLIYNNQSV